MHPRQPKNCLHTLRVESGHSVTTLASTIGVTRDTIFRWERGNRHPKLSQVERLAMVFNCEPDDIFAALSC